MNQFKNILLYSFICSIGLTNCFGQKPGDAYQGGIIFYIFKKGDMGYVAGEVHGLIAATKDQTTMEEWEKMKDGAVRGCYETELLKVDRTAIGMGAQNTRNILARCNEDGIAAKLASDYQVKENGVTYDDWFLPSKDELNKLESEIKSINPKIKVSTLVSDLSTKEGSLNFIDFVIKNTNKIDVLVNNVGTFIPGKLKAPFRLELSDENMLINSEPGD